MSKTKNIEYSKVVRPAILKRDNYMCKFCNIRNGARVYDNSGRDYVECDEFIEEWAKANNKKVYSVGLEVVKIDESINGFAPSNLISLCKKCRNKKSKIYLQERRKLFNELIKKQSSNKVGAKLYEIDSKVKEVKLLVNSFTSVVISDAQAQTLINEVLI